MAFNGSSAPAAAAGAESTQSSPPPHARAAQELIRTLQTDASTGLGSAAANTLLARYGRNELAQAPAEPWWRRLARQFADLLIWILIAAALISGALGEWIDAAAILAIVILNGVLGFVQEGRAEQALASLRKLSSPQAKVVRDGRSQNVPAAELVPGDRIDLEAGDRVPAVARCRSAGIHPVMITGDHPDTAKAIAADLGILREGQRVVIGRELDTIDDTRLNADAEQIPVYARVTAAHKMRIIKAWRQRGHVVAMTGDGVNDVPAIKAADVGIAMGITGTDVTKEASDMVLTDDNFASIVNAVEEGRTIYDNIRKFVHYLLATNAGEVMLMFVAVLIGWPAPLVAIQILWINLVTDALPAMALGVEPPEPDVMGRPPRPPSERVMTRQRGLLMLYHGALNAGVTAIAFFVMYRGHEETVPAARTAAFATLAFAQLFFSFGCRSERYTLPQLGLFSNPWLLGAIGVSALLQLGAVAVPFLQPLFNVAAAPSAWEWALIALLALTPVTFIEIAKLVKARL